MGNHGAAGGDYSQNGGILVALVVIVMLCGGML